MPGGSKAALIAAATKNALTTTTFDTCEAMLEKEMAGDILPRYIKSPAWQAVLHGGAAPAPVPPVSPIIQPTSLTGAPPAAAPLPVLMYVLRVMWRCTYSGV